MRGGWLWLAWIAAATAAAAAPQNATLLVVDAMAVPGIALVATFAPQVEPEGGVRHIGGREDVTATAVMRLDQDLPVHWMASVFRKGDIAANQLTRPVADAGATFYMAFSNQVSIMYSGGAWHLPNYDAGRYAVEVGFGFAAQTVTWAYSVPARPGDTIRMIPGSYGFLRPTGDATMGAAVSAPREIWSILPGSSNILTFDASGNGVLKPLP